jgi:hypothetical protein
MKVAFILSGLPNGLQCLDRNRERVAKTLKNYGWITRVDTTFYSQASLLATINEYKDYEIDDFIFFYTGHGDASSDEGILTLRLHDGTTIDINTLHREYFSKLNINRKAIILDACYSGNFEGRKFHEKTEYLCSSDFDEESYEDVSEDGLNYSYFSYYFCEALDNLEGMITLEVINEKYLQPHVDIQNSKYISIDSKMVIVDKNYMNIKNDLAETIEKEASPLNQIFLIFNEDNTSTKYHVEGHIQYEDEFENDLIEFTFTNIYDKLEQNAFIQLLIDEFEENITIHFIVPPELFLVNFKQWKYNGNELVKRYHILLHNKDRYNSKSRKYKNMIDSWQVLFEAQKDNKLSDALLVTSDDSSTFDTRLDKMGVCFKQSLSNCEVISNTLDMAKVGLWQCEEGILTEYHTWVDGNLCLKELNETSRQCDHVALLWDDMSLLEKLKGRKL